MSYVNVPMHTLFPQALPLVPHFTIRTDLVLLAPYMRTETDLKPRLVPYMLQHSLHPVGAYDYAARRTAKLVGSAVPRQTC